MLSVFLFTYNRLCMHTCVRALQVFMFETSFANTSPTFPSTSPPRPEHYHLPMAWNCHRSGNYIYVCWIFAHLCYNMWEYVCMCVCERLNGQWAFSIVDTMHFVYVCVLCVGNSKPFWDTLAWRDLTNTFTIFRSYLISWTWMWRKEYLNVEIMLNSLTLENIMVLISHGTIAWYLYDGGIFCEKQKGEYWNNYDCFYGRICIHIDYPLST